MFSFLQKYKSVLLYGFSLAVLLCLLQLLEYRLIIIDHAFEVYIACIAILFTALGIWLSLRLMKPKTDTPLQTIVEEKWVYVKEEATHETIQINEAERTKLGLSNREMEVLSLMAKGLSNQEIADQLYLSLNTIKTHSSKLFEKMEVKRRTQAIEKAKRLQLIV